MQKIRRIPLIDTLRGLAILCMILVHLIYDLYTFCGLDVGISTSFWNFATSLGGIFVLISGTSARLASKTLKRGLIVLGCGIIITIVTMIIGDGTQIYFGILHLLGLCMIIYHFLHRPLERIPTQVGLTLWLCCFVFWLIFFFTKSWPFEGLFWLGLPGYNFVSADYYPLLPWFFLFLFGTSLGEVIKRGRLPEWFYTFNIKFLSLIGRHTLPIYMLHQPVMIGVLWLLLKLGFL